MTRMKSYALMVVSLIALTVFLGSASAQDVSRQESRKARLEREIAILDGQIAENASKSSTVLSSLELVRKNIANRKALVAESDKEIRRYSDSLYLKQRHINRIQARVDTLTSHYSRLVMSAYRNRDTRLWYMYMLASENLGQAYRRFGYFRNLSSQMKEEARKIRALKEELEIERNALSQMKAAAEAVKADRVKELEKLKKDEAKSDAIVKQLKKDCKKYEKQLTAKKKEIVALNREIQRIIAEATRPSSQKGSGVQKDDPAAVALSAEFAKNKGKLPWPVNGSIVKAFGKQYHPVFRNLELPPNNGIDIAVPEGTQAKVVFDGTVKQVFVMPGYNQCVLVQHGKNYFTFYCRLASVNVKSGAKVVTGEVVGTVDKIQAQSQLHFELWKNTVPQDPEGWIR